MRYNDSFSRYIPNCTSFSLACRVKTIVEPAGVCFVTWFFFQLQSECYCDLRSSVAFVAIFSLKMCWFLTTRL